jgi:acyl carrier protein
MRNVQDRVITSITEVLGMKKGDVTIDSTVDSLNMDSLDVVESLMFLEEEFDIEIPDDDAEKITSVRGAIDYITPLI